MPLSAMETTLELEKVSKKCTDIQDIVKSPKTILDFFKTPEKPVLSKQKSLLQYFTKSSAPNDSNLDISTEKENAGSLVEKSSLTDINCPTDGDLAAEKPKTKKKENTPYEVKTNKKGIKKKKDDEIVPDNKINKSSHSVCIADEYPIHDDSEDSVVLVSDLSTLDETLTEHSNEKATENNRFPEKQASESNAETKSDSETDNSEMDSHQKISSNEDKTEELVTEVNRHEESITYKETSNDHSQESIGHEKSDQCNKEQLKQEDAVFIKPCNSKLLAKKKAMKCKEMMNLLKETIGTDMKIGKGSKNHKHKHKHKDKTGQEMENKVNRLKEIVSEKRKGRKKVKFSESVHNEVKAEGKSKETVSELTENDSKDKTNSETAGDGCPNEPSECKSEEKDPEMNSGTRSYTNNKNLVDKQDDKQDSENHNVENKKKQYKKLQKTKRTDNDSIMSKKRTSHKTDKAANTRENKEDCDTKTENNTSETKSISYEDFLKSLEKEPSGILDEPAPLEVKGDTKTEKSNSELIEDSIQSISEDMDVEVMESGTDEPEKVLEENSETLQEAEMSVTKPSDITERSKVCHTPKVKKKQNENEKSESLAETKSGGIARFFTVLTSTPDKPKTDAERKNIQQQISLPSNKNPKKNKKCNKLEKVANDSSNINMEKKPEENSVLKEQKDGNISGSDSIEIVEDTVEDGSKIEKDAGTQKRKHEFLNSRSSVNSCKTTQAVLSFGTTGLTMAKCENVDVNAGDEDHTDDNTNVKSQKTKVKKGSKPAVKSKQKQNLSDDSNVFETPKAKSKGRKSKSKDKAHIQPSESEESYDHSQTDDSEDSTRRRSLRSRYKVAMFEMDEEKRIPIKLKLKRDKNSSSCDEIDGTATKTKKSKLTSKQSKAKALIDKAKKRKKKAKLKAEYAEKDKEEDKVKKKSKRKSDKGSDEEVVEHRRSSRLVGKTMPSMEEVSLEHIVILSDEDEEDGIKIKKKKARKTEKIEKSVKKKDNIQEIPVAKDSSKPKKVASPQKKTATPKKQGKLAPIFMGKTKPGEEKKPPLDPELAKQRMQFLMSGVPEELKKQSAKTQAAVVPTDYPPLPTVSHVLQIPKTEDSVEGCQGELDVWGLKAADLKYRSAADPFSILPMSRFTGDLINRQMVNVDLSLIKSFTHYPPLDSKIEEACVGEVSCYYPGFPVNKLFAALKQLKEAAEQSQLETDAGKTETQPTEPEVITVIDGETEKKKRGRKSRLKLQKEDKLEEKPTQPLTPSEASEKKKYVRNLLWTDKYQPSSSTEVIGNSSSMKKLKTWLSEWKHILDREAKKARKLLMKKNKGKLQKTEAADDGWDEDSDFDMDSDDSDIEDTLCNTMLITGPHGSGKTAAVYALAQELGFKVHEVNASSSRNGKKILSQLQEATQSHQVSHQGCGTPVKNPGTPGSLTPKPAKMPTAFTNLFSKKKDNSTVIDVEEKKTKKRKREPADIEESPKKKRSKNDNKERKTKTLKPTFLDIDESSNGLVQGLNLSSTTMILFDEVDLVFEDDKGFLSAVQTFMATTKIPIVLTTTRLSFAAQFDGRYETLTFKYPSVSSLCSYLQLICLLEGLRIDPTVMSELLQLLDCDVRKSLLSLQFISESGGSLSQTFCSVAKPSTVETNQPVPVVKDTIRSSQDSQDSSKAGYNQTFGDNDDDDFVMLKPQMNRQRRLLEDDNSNSVDAFAQMFSQRQPEIMLTNKGVGDAKLYPCVYGLGISSLVGLTPGNNKNLQDILLRNLKMPTVSNLLESCNVCEIYRTFCQNLLSNNLLLLLPLVTRVTDHVISSGKHNSGESKGKKRKRIQTDLYDSEASNDACDGIDINTDENSTEVETKTESNVSNKAENRCSVKALSAFSRFYDTVGMLDMIETQEKLKLVNSVRTTCGRRTYGSVQSGLDDSLPQFPTPCDVDCEVSRCYCGELEVRSMCRLYQEIDGLQGEVEQLCNNNPAYSEDYVLPVLRGNEKFSLVDRNIPCQSSGERRAEDNIVQNLPLLVHKHHKSLQLDYLPTLREISRTEHNRQIANTKRRFHHYFDNITLPLKDTTLNILSSTFT